jgi:hypothetical protein
MRFADHTNIIGSCLLATPAAYSILEPVFFWGYIHIDFLARWLSMGCDRDITMESTIPPSLLRMLASVM